MRPKIAEVINTVSRTRKKKDHVEWLRFASIENVFRVRDVEGVGQVSCLVIWPAESFVKGEVEGRNCFSDVGGKFSWRRGRFWPYEGDVFEWYYSSRFMPVF